MSNGEPDDGPLPPDRPGPEAPEPRIAWIAPPRLGRALWFLGVAGLCGWMLGADLPLPAVGLLLAAGVVLSARR